MMRLLLATLVTASGLLALPGIAAEAFPAAADEAVEQPLGPVAAAVPSRIVAPGPDGRLQYPPTADGDVLIDFSSCGYRGGGVALPVAPVRLTLTPVATERDALARIQAAIDQVAAAPLDAAGLRGAVLLKRGRYLVHGTLRIAASGVVLRGEGPGQDGGVSDAGTVLIATLRKQHDVIVVSGSGRMAVLKETTQLVTDQRVPAGAFQLSVADASAFQIGDRVLVSRPSTAAWLADIKMDRLVETYRDAKAKNWTPGSFDLHQRRTITAISGSRLTFDAPMVQALEARYGGGTVAKFRPDGQIERAGVEDLTIESEYDATIRSESAKTGDPLESIRRLKDENHAWIGVVLDNVRDGWVARVTTRYAGYGCAHTHGSAERTTIRDCVMIDPVAENRGGRKYSFVSGGQLGLFLACVSRNSRHDFAFGSRAVGPTAFVDCRASAAGGTTEPHHRYAAGGLFDNVSLRGEGFFLAVNRGNSGSGHGWAGAQMVFWNCVGQSIFVMKPPGAQNYAVGWNGPTDPTLLGVSDQYSGQLGWIKDRSTVAFTWNGVPVMGDGYIESPDRPVTPRSLYFKQLEDRLGAGAVAAVLGKGR